MTAERWWPDGDDGLRPLQTIWSELLCERPATSYPAEDADDSRWWAAQPEQVALAEQRAAAFAADLAELRARPARRQRSSG